MKTLQKLFLLLLIVTPISAFANIDSSDKWAWGEDI